MRNRKKKIYPLAIIIFGLVMVFAAIAVCSVSIKRHLQSEMENTLRDIATQNVLAVTNEIETQFRLLLGFSQRMEKSPSDLEDILEEMSIFVKTYDFKRMGYTGRDGLALTTDGHEFDVSDTTFFQRSMEGKIWITAAIADGFDSREMINVFSVPVYNEDRSEVEGVIFASYNNDIFQKMLSVDFFEGRGYSCIVKTDGTVMAHSQNSPLLEDSNFFDHMLDDDRENDISMVEQIKADMQNAESGAGRCGHVHGRAESSLFYYMPMNENLYDAQWYMIAIAPESVLNERTMPVMYDVRVFALVMLVIAVLGVSFYLYIEKKRQEELVSLAYEDRLTGGYNLAGFRENAKTMTNQTGYVVAMDLTEFKLINNNFGVQTGDETLLELWKVLKGNIFDQEMVARVNADRFVLFLRTSDKEELEERLNGMVSQIAEISNRLKIPVLFPVFGIYYTRTLEEPDKCYGYAVQAKHLVKGRRDRHFAYYDEIDSAQMLMNRRLENSFDDALKEGQFEIWYQPKYSTQEEKIIGAEALVRWRMADGTLLSPGVFIPLFEKNGSIAVLDEYIFRKVCEQQRQWMLDGHELLPVSVNISRVSLYFDNIVERYEKILHSYNLVSKYVQLEITESATVGNDEIAGLIERFHRAGFQMLLDDFGSGYSSLASLNTMHFDTLKLDKSLIDYIGDEKGEKLLKYIAKLGQSLGLHITAEGVENQRQLMFLKNLRCNDIQGYYFSKPLPLEEYASITYSE